MRLLPQLVTAPEPLLTVDQAKNHCRVDTDTEDTLFIGLIAAATAHLDGHSGILGRALVTQSWRQDFAWFCRGGLRLPLAPASEVTHVKYRDLNDVEQTLSPSTYGLYADALSPIVVLRSGQAWPSTYDRPDAVSVTFVAGYGAAAAVPAPIRQAVLLLIGHWHANRETVNVGNITSALAFAVDALVAQYRRTGF